MMLLNKLVIRLFIIVLYSFLAPFGHTQALPPISVYTPKDYNAETQNWSISQDEESNIYVANNKGLLVYNGAYWTLYPSPNQTIMRSVLSLREKIYAGYYMEFGYWQENKKGVLIYTSLLDKLNQPLIEDEQFWNIISVDQWVLFQSLDRLYVYDTQSETFEVINSVTELVKMFKVGNDVYFQRRNEGLFKLENGEDTLVSDDGIFKDNLLVGVFDNDGDLLVQTQNNGFFILDDLQTRPWSNNANAMLKGESVYSSSRLQNGNFVVGTISNGAFFFTKTGQLIYHLQQGNGLSNNTILSIFEDQEDNVWLALDNGINCVNVNSPFSIYSDTKGTLGTIYQAIVHNNKLYLGTNQGLFHKTYKSAEPFMFIEGTEGQVWRLKAIHDQLFCGHNVGTFLVNDGKVIKISEVQGIWDIKEIPGKPNILLQGDYNGLSILEFKNNKWQDRNRIDGFDISSRFFELVNGNQIFVNHEYKGVYKNVVNQDFTAMVSVTKDSISKGLHSSLVKYNNNLYYGYEDGVYKYDDSAKVFKRDSILSQAYNDQIYVSGKLEKTSDNILWSFTKGYINCFKPSALSDQLSLTRIPITNALRKSITNYESVLKLEDSKYLFGTTLGYLIIDLDKLKSEPYQINIDKISVSTIEKGFELIDKTTEREIPFKQNNIKFDFSSIDFDKYLEVEYQTKLEGFYNEWSSWSYEPAISFENLPYGSYTFNVRSKVGDNISENVSQYSFKILRPWYLSNALLALYAILFLALLLLTHNFYKAYYKRQRKKLLERTQRELELKELENEQERMRFKNQSLEQDIESKNRELAISTMSLIKKNEFLNGIKEELRKSDSEVDVKRVIKIIDKNLNNTDDWKIFEEAFNNADKDFLKKVKSKHNALTPNDLKLCAYLRLNLSSKEIAPLLNISPRSVEVKRYRLRKKMNLPHETSLTNYIIDL